MNDASIGSRAETRALVRAIQDNVAPVMPGQQASAAVCPQRVAE